MKRIVSIFLALLVLLSFSACGSSDDENTTSTSAQNVGTIAIETETQNTEAPETEAMEESELLAQLDKAWDVIGGEIAAAISCFPSMPLDTADMADTSFYGSDAIPRWFGTFKYYTNDYSSIGYDSEGYDGVGEYYCFTKAFVHEIAYSMTGNDCSDLDYGLAYSFSHESEDCYFFKVAAGDTSYYMEKLSESYDGENVTVIARYTAYWYYESGWETARENVPFGEYVITISPDISSITGYVIRSIAES